MHGVHERNWLAEIATMLLSLAMIADIAAGVSPRKRRELLDIVRLGKASGLRVAIAEGMLDAQEAQAYPFASAGACGPDDARHLSICLRVLAMALHFRAKLCEQRREAHPPAKEHTPPAGCFIIARTQTRAAQAIPLIDTS